MPRLRLAAARRRPAGRASFLQAMGGRGALSVLAVVVATVAPVKTAAGWQRADVKAVTQPAAVGDRFVVYAARRGLLQVVALDARTGSTAWSAAATPSQIAPGEPPVLTVIGGDVFYLGRRGGSLAELVARNVATGQVRWRSPLGAFTTWPGVCPDQTTAICLSGLLSTSSQQGAELRFDAKGGKQLPGALIEKRFGGRELAPGLFDPGQRNPEVLLATSAGRVTWRRPLRAVFTLPGASTDWGWNFDRAGRLGLYVGSPGWKPIKLTSTRFVADLSKAMTAGFRIGDGAVAWRSAGTYMCNFLPCPGGSEAEFSTPANAGGSSPTVAVRVRATGRVSGTFNGLPVASPSTRVTIEGFDPGTGHTRWRYDAGHAPGLVTQRVLPPRINGSSIVLPRGNRLIALELVHGRTRPIAPSAAAWCRAPVLYRQRTGYPGANGSRLTEYVGQFALYPCTTRGRRRATHDAPPSFLSAIAAHSGGVIAWTDKKGIVAVRVG